MRFGVEAAAADVSAAGADEVIVAAGSRPPSAGFQRALPLADRLPGVDAPDVFSIQAVLDGAPVPGERVLVLDDCNDWRGLGTALYLAESGHDVTILTSAAVVAGGLFHSAADGPLRRRYAAAGGRSLTSSCILEWGDGGRAIVRSTLTDETSVIEADALVIAETPVAETRLADELTALGIAFHQVGDCVAPRRASLAFFEARELARRL